MCIRDSHGGCGFHEKSGKETERETSSLKKKHSPAAWGLSLIHISKDLLLKDKNSRNRPVGTRTPTVC